MITRPLHTSAVLNRRTRVAAVLDVLRAEGASSIVDLGCGEGALLRELVAHPRFASVLGVDVSHRALELAAKRLNLHRNPSSASSRTSGYVIFG